MSANPAPAPAEPDLQAPDPVELGAWLRLLATPGVGRATARRLLAAFGAPLAVFEASDAARRAVVPVAVAQALSQPPDGHERQLARTLQWLAGAPQRRVRVLGDAAYPDTLLQIEDPPLLLFLDGDLRCLGPRSVAVVGSRRPTPQGRDNARRFAAELAGQGWTVVSGLAAGIDGAAHQGALDAGPAGAGTLAVVGTGIDRVYPASHRALAERIVAEGGLVMSELPLGAPPLAAHFPMRNRLIAGLTRGTLVVEAALRSGSLITARMAVEAGREVLVIPGSIHAEQAAGCHELIRQGATLVVSAAQVVEALEGLALGAPPLAMSTTPAGKTAAAHRASEAQPDPPPDPGTTDDPILLALGHDPASLDVLIARTGWPAPRLSAHLLTLELDGQVARLPGGLYQRTAGA